MNTITRLNYNWINMSRTWKCENHNCISHMETLVLGLICSGLLFMKPSINVITTPFPFLFFRTKPPKFMVI